MFSIASIRVAKNHDRTPRPDSRIGNTKLGLIGTGLQCTLGFAVTDFRAQSRTLGKTESRLYGKTKSMKTGGLEKCDAVTC